MGQMSRESFVGYSIAPNLASQSDVDLYVKMKYTLKELQGRTPKRFSFETTIGKNPNIFCITEKEWNAFSKEY
jgi:hypothetical protein